jgi:hypothetical protein
MVREALNGYTSSMMLYFLSSVFFTLGGFTDCRNRYLNQASAEKSISETENPFAGSNKLPLNKIVSAALRPVSLIGLIAFMGWTLMLSPIYLKHDHVTPILYRISSVFYLVGTYLSWQNLRREGRLEKTGYFVYLGTDDSSSTKTDESSGSEDWVPGHSEEADVMDSGLQRSGDEMREEIDVFGGDEMEVFGDDGEDGFVYTVPKISGERVYAMKLGAFVTEMMGTLFFILGGRYYSLALPFVSGMFYSLASILTLEVELNYPIQCPVD